MCLEINCRQYIDRLSQIKSKLITVQPHAMSLTNKTADSTIINRRYLPRTFDNDR